MNYVGGSWTLLIELVWYVGFCAAFFTGIAQRNSLFFGLAIFAAIAVAFLGLIAPMRLPLGRLDFIFICCAGLLFLRNFEGIVTGRSFFIFVSLLLASIAVGIFIGFYIRPEAGGEGFDFTAVIFSWSAGVALFVVFYFLRGTKIASLGLLTYLGRISYSVYLLHSPLLLLFEHFHISGFNLLALTVICTLASAHLTFKFIEQPFIRWARLSGKRSASFRGA
jgi:peptidoglycan/LPS O-acetylase OafA/YrhL